MKTQNIHSLPFQAREALRREAIKAILEGRTQIEVARLFGVTRQAVCKWVKAYRAKGEEGLRARKSGRPKKASLLHLQTMQIVTLVADYYPEQLGLPFYLWTREAVAQLIEQRFGVRFSIQTVGRYLGDWGFIPQRPLYRVLEKKREEICLWLQKEYPKILKQAKREKALIYWGDVIGLCFCHRKGCSNRTSGQIPLIFETPEGINFNIILAITNRGQFNFIVFKKHLCAEVFEAFIRRLVRHSKRKVLLIFDRNCVYRGRKIEIWTRSHLHHTHHLFLTGDSPQVNSEESLKRNFQGVVVERPLYMDKLGLIANV